MKALIILSILCLAASAAKAQQTTDDSGTGSLNLEGSSTVTRWGLALPPHSVPELCVSSLPSGALGTWGTALASTPASSDALENAAQSLKQLSEGTTPSARALWGALMAICSTGILANFLITFRSISKAEIDPVEGLLRWFLRSSVAICGMSWGAGAIPWLSIIFCNLICSAWIADPAVAAAQAQRYQLANYFQSSLAARVQQAATVLADNDPAVAGNNAAQNEEEVSLRTQIASAAAQAMGGPALNPALYKTGVEAVYFFVEVRLGISAPDGRDLSGGGSYAKNYQAEQDAVKSTPLDRKAVASSSKSLGVALYAFAIESAIEIWGLPLAIGVWSALYSWPQNCGFPGLPKLGFLALLTMILAFAIASSLAISGLVATGGGEEYSGGYLSFLGSQIGRLEGGNVSGAVVAGVTGTATALTSLSSGQWTNWLTGVSWQLIFLTSLIVLSPGIAAGLIKGGAVLGSIAAKNLSDHGGGGGGAGRWTGGYGSFDSTAGGAGSPQKPPSRQDML